MMKSRIIVAKPVIISYGLSVEQSDKLSGIAQKLNISHKAAAADEAGEKIGYLCGFRGFERSENAEVLEGKQCLMFSGIQRKELDVLLGELRAAGISVPLKAMVTPSNQSWTLSALITELEKEHEFMTRRKN